MFYHFLRIVVIVGIRLFYRQIRVKNRMHIDTKGPKIIIANHPNTLMDAWMIGYICKQRVYYMAKGTFFSSPLRRWVLNGLGMIPVNRMIDSKTPGVSNIDSFEACYRLLEEGKTLVIFPEGNSFQERLLRRLKSGAARIAIQTELRNSGKLNLTVVPIGLIYVQPEKFRSSVLATVGQPIFPALYIEEFKKDSLKSARKLTEEFRMGLSRILLHSEEKEEEELVENIVDILSSDYVKTDRKGVERDVYLMRSIFDQMNAFRISQPWRIAEIKFLVEDLNWKIQSLDIKPGFLDRKYRGRMFSRQLLTSFFFLLMGLPFFLFGAIHNIIQYKLVDVFVTNRVKDVEYHAPVSVLLSLILYPIMYFCFLFTFSELFAPKYWVKSLYFLAMPASGLLAFYYSKYYRHILFKRKFILLMRSKKNDIESLKKERDSLRKLIFDN
jgi:1-acyl-sn-glycerol-3-phosphate acyltransferase